MADVKDKLIGRAARSADGDELSPAAGVTDREWQVLTVLWRCPCLSVLEIRDLLSKQLVTAGRKAGLAVTTVATFVSRLVRKGLLRIELRQPSDPSPVAVRRTVRTRGRPFQQRVKRYEAIKSRDELLGEELARPVRAADDPVGLILAVLGKLGLSAGDRARIVRYLQTGLSAGEVPPGPAEGRPLGKDQ